MEFTVIEDAIALLEKANASLQPRLLDASGRRRWLERYARAQKLTAFGIAALAGCSDNPEEVARVTGTSMGKAKDVVATGKTIRQSDVLGEAFKHGEVSLEQATEIARAEESAPGVANKLLSIANKEPFQVLKEKARKAKLEAEQHKDLAGRQHKARCARRYSDELGMVHIHLALEPHVGTPIVARAEAEAARIAKTAKKNGEKEPFERHLADGYAKLLSGQGKGPARRPELVILVSHEVAKRGWKDVKKGEVCKIPGVGPVSPQVAEEIAKDAFLNGVFYDGKDLTQYARWSRHIPIEVQVALELGDPPEFDGVVCVDCGNRFKTEFDHIEPRSALGPTSNDNLSPRCWPCHHAKTERDRKAGKLGTRCPDP